MLLIVKPVYWDSQYPVLSDSNQCSNTGDNETLHFAQGDNVYSSFCASAKELIIKFFYNSLTLKCFRVTLSKYSFRKDFQGGLK